MVVLFFFSGRSECVVLGYHFLHHYPAYMALHTLFHEPNFHYELHDVVSLLLLRFAVFLCRSDR